MMSALLSLALTVGTAHPCTVPRSAYLQRDLTAREQSAMERFSYCLCGPEGSTDWDPRPHRHGGYFMHPSCNRNGWNGHKYRGAS